MCRVNSVLSPPALESFAGFGKCHHQQWSTWGFHPYWSCRHCTSSSCGCVPPEASQPGHVAAVHWSSWVGIQEHQVHCRMSCWWAYQCCQGLYCIRLWQGCQKVLSSGFIVELGGRFCHLLLNNQRNWAQQSSRIRTWSRWWFSQLPAIFNNPQKWNK